MIAIELKDKQEGVQWEDIKPYRKIVHCEQCAGEEVQAVANKKGVEIRWNLLYSARGYFVKPKAKP